MIGPHHVDHISQAQKLHGLLLEFSHVSLGCFRIQLTHELISSSFFFVGLLRFDSFGQHWYWFDVLVEDLKIMLRFLCNPLIFVFVLLNAWASTAFQYRRIEVT